MHIYLFFVPGKLRVEYAIQYCYCISDVSIRNIISWQLQYLILGPMI